MKRFSVLLIFLSTLVIAGLYSINIIDKKRGHTTMSLPGPVKEIKKDYTISVGVLNWFF